jgi:hypothetical protein
MMWRGTVMTVSLVALAQSVAAQGADSTRAELRTLIGIADNRHWYVRVETVDGTQLEGNLARVPGDAVRVAATEVPLTSIHALYRRATVGSGTDEGMAAGGVLFGLMGLGIAAIACAYSEGRCNPALSFAIGAAGGATIGMVIGGLAGSMFEPGSHIWELQWRVR